MYMATCYNGQLGNNWGVPTNQSQETIRSWHFNDLPDNYEIARNEYIYNLQGNRNPFIDSVDFACFIDFHQMTYNTNICGDLGMLEQLNSNFSVFPIPAKNVMYAQVNGLNIKEYILTNGLGQVVLHEIKKNLPVVKIDTTNLPGGTYILSVKTDKGTIEKLVLID